MRFVDFRSVLLFYSDTKTEKRKRLPEESYSVSINATMFTLSCNT